MMPLLKDTVFEKAPLPNDLVQDEEVFHCVITNEIFRDYDEFCQRIILCNSMVWTCEYTEKTGLTYLEALESEKQAQESFKDLSTELRVAVLFLASKTHRNSISEMVEDLYTFMKDRFFIGENVAASFTNNKWIESHILQVIGPTEKQLKSSPKNGHTNGNRHFYPPSSLFRYEVEQLDPEDKDSAHIMVVNADQIKRKRRLTRDKLKYFLKQYITQSDNSIYVIKEKVLRSFGIPSMQFGKIFDGPLPNFDVSKFKKKKQKFITEFLTENQNGVLLEKLGKLRTQGEIALRLKEWYLPKEDLLLEDHKALPVPAPVQSKVPEQYLGDVIAIIEFSHILFKLALTKAYFRNELTFELMERALTQKEINGPLCDVIQMFLRAIFQLQETEKYVKVDCSGDEKVKDVNGNIRLSEATLFAAKASSLSLEHYGFPLNKLPLYALTTTEIVRMHLLSSGARLTEYGARLRYQARGGYTSEEDPALDLRLKYPHIIKALAFQNIHNLPIGGKLKIINCLLNQILTYAPIRDHLDAQLEKAKQAKLDLKIHPATERKLEQEYQTDKAKIIKADINVKWNLEKLGREYDKKRNQNAREFKNLQKIVSKAQTLLGQDRAFRKYFKIYSLPGVFVSMEDDVGPCLDECVKHVPHLVGADKSTVMAHIRKVCEEMSNSDKENVEHQNTEGNDNDTPKLVNGTQDPLIEQARTLLMCCGDSAKCPVHSVSMKQKWAFLYEAKQIDELIESLNERGIRESELKQALISDREDLIAIVNQTPIANLNPYIQSDAESRLRPRKWQGKLKYDNPNFGFVDDTDPLTVLQHVLTDNVLQMEGSIFSGTIGLLKVKDRDNWRALLSDKNFERFVKTYEEEVKKSSRPGDYTDPGQFLSSSIQIGCDDDATYYSNLLNLSEHHRCAIRALSIALVQISQGLEEQYLQKPLGNAGSYNNKNLKGGLLNKWEQSLLSSSSYDQVFLHYATLNKCIFWARSSLLTKCQVCRKQSNAESMILCESCNNGQHLFCFKPKLTAVPEGGWYCKNCKTDEDSEVGESPRQTRSRWKQVIDPDTPESSEDEVEEEEEEEEEEIKDNNAQEKDSNIELPVTYKVLEEVQVQEEDEDSTADEDEQQQQDDDSNDLSYSDGEEFSDDESESSVENETCYKCKTGGTLLCCDNCPSMYHMKCAEPPIRRVPRGKWFCHNCKDDAQRSGNISNQRRCAAKARDKIHGFARSLRRISESEDSTSGSESGSSSRKSKRRESDRRDDLPLHNAPLQEVLADVLKQEYAWPFIRPVVKNEVPDYYDIITKPMDFGTIKYKLNMGEYKCDADLMDDAALVFDNCNTYNSADDEVYHCGVKLLKYFISKCHQHGLKVSPRLEDDISPPTSKRMCVE